MRPLAGGRSFYPPGVTFDHFITRALITWYWLADLCVQEGLTFVLGHAQSMKAIHGGKAQHDRLDA